MAKSNKRRNYLIDKPFQIGFILKYLFVILFTVFACFIVAAMYYYQDSFFGTKKLNQNIMVMTRGHKVNEKGFKIYDYQDKKIHVYEEVTNGETIFKVENPFNTNYKKGDIVNVSKTELTPSMGLIPKSTKLFHIVIFPLLWTCLAIMIIIAVYSLFFSHRMAGPVYRMRVSLERMLAGDFDFRIRVRKNDFFINLVEKIEQLRLKVKTEFLDKDSE